VERAAAGRRGQPPRLRTAEPPAPPSAAPVVAGGLRRQGDRGIRPHLGRRGARGRAVVPPRGVRRLERRPGQPAPAAASGPLAGAGRGGRAPGGGVCVAPVAARSVRRGGPAPRGLRRARRPDRVARRAAARRSGSPAGRPSRRVGAGRPHGPAPPGGARRGGPARRIRRHRRRSPRHGLRASLRPAVRPNAAAALGTATRRPAYRPLARRRKWRPPRHAAGPGAAAHHHRGGRQRRGAAAGLLMVFTGVARPRVARGEGPPAEGPATAPRRRPMRRRPRRGPRCLQGRTRKPAPAPPRR
jgi:hypothetical protein